MAAIDKAIAKIPAPAQPPAVPAKSGRAPVPPGRGGTMGTWFRVLLGVVLAAGMTQWPYVNDCGPALFIYLGAAGLVVVTGVWGSVSSWRRRLGLAHTLSLLVTAWGLGLTAAVLLPRLGYARENLPWFCP
jgi:hypothetical protein